MATVDKKTGKVTVQKGELIKQSVLIKL